MAHKNHPGSSSGRTVKARDLQYIQRPADAELLDHCQNGRPTYILHSPQMGKSSLIAHTAEQLNANSHHAILIDLSQFPLPPRKEEWFHTIVRILNDNLDLTTDVMAWWAKPSIFALPPQERLTKLITEVILPEIDAPLVLFIDEIERTMALPFRVAFFQWLTTLYESRATDSILYRLSFVVCGVATPSQLLPEDESSSLFQWSHRVRLSDFTLEEALPLAEGLSLPTEAATEAVKWVYRWTQGHPYLTQLLCRLLEEQHRTTWLETEVDECVRHFIGSLQGLREPNFQFVRTALTEPFADGKSLLEPYLDVLEGKTENVGTNQAALEQLRLVGVLRENDKEIAIRNPLYEEVFPPAWAKRHIRSSAPAVQALSQNNDPQPKHSYVMAASLFLLGVVLLLWFFRFPTSPNPSVSPAQVASPSPAIPSEASGTPKTPQQPEALAQAQKEIQELEATIVRYQQVSGDETKNLLDQRTKLETQLTSREEALSDLHAEVQKLTSKISDEQDAYEQSLSALRAERAKLQSEATSTSRELASALEEVKDLQLAVLKKSSLSPSETKKLMAARSELGTQLKTANTELALAHERARNLDALLSQHKQLVQTESQRHTADRERLESTIKGLEVSLAENRQMFVTKEETAREQAELARSELNRLQQDRTKYKELLSANQKELSTIKNQAVTFETALTQKDQTIKEEKQKRSHLETLLAEQQEKSDGTLTTLRQEHAQLTTELQDLRSRESQATSRVSQLETLIAQKNSDADNSLTALQKERDELSTELNQVKRELNSATTQVATLGDKLSTAIGQVAISKNSLQSINTASSEKARRSEEEFTKLALARSTLQTKLEESQTALAEAGKQITQLENKSAKNLETQGTLKQTKEERDQYSQKLQGTEQQLAKAQQQIHNLEKSLRAASSVAKSTSKNSPLTAIPDKSLRARNPSKNDFGNVVSRITAKLTQSPSPLKSETTRLLWARQAYVLNLQGNGMQWSTIDRSLRKDLHTSPIQLKGVSTKIHTVTFDPSGDHVIGGTSDGTVFLWSVNNPLDSPQIFTGHTAGVLSVAIHPNGQQIASGSLDSTIRLWDLSEPSSPPRILQAHTKGITSVAFKPNGKQLASGSQDHTIRLWDLTSKQPKATTLGTHAGRVNAIAFTPSGNRLLAGGDDLTLRIWDLERKDSPPKILRGHKQRITSIAIHPSGRLVATGSRDRQIGLWNLHQSIISPTFLTGSTGRIARVQFSPDGASVASVGSDKSLRIWNWQDPTQQPIQFSGHKGALEALAVSPDGQTFAVGGSDKKVILWSGTGQLAHAVCDTAKENIPFAEWKQIAGEAVPYERTCPNLPIHPTFIEEGKKLAKQGARKQAQAIFERAKQLDPYLEIDTEKELNNLSAKSS